MKKNIVIVALVIMVLMSFMYAYVQKAEADKQIYLAKQQEHLAFEAQKQAIECQQTAERLQQAMADALAASEAQKAIAEKNLSDSKK
jgi:hypothetical protein